MLANCGSVTTNYAEQIVGKIMLDGLLIILGKLHNNFRDIFYRLDIYLRMLLEHLLPAKALAKTCSLNKIQKGDTGNIITGKIFSL